MAKKYLDETGLSYFWSKVKAYIDAHSGGASFPVGSVVCMDTNTNPSSDLGGTWELIDKEFKEKTFLTADLSQVFTAESTTTTGTTCITLHNHMISIERMTVASSSAISDTTVTLGAFDLTKLGVASGNLIVNKYFVAQSDGGNGIAMMVILTSGSLQTLDRVTATSGGTIAGGNNLNFAFDIQLRTSEMLDSFCDKFYFKRTA